jgi:hypothetical protein
MPNATVRANARPMPETPNRRAVLGALAAGAAASVVAVSTAAVAAGVAPDSRDAELFALIGATREAKARRLAATEEMHEAERRIPHVPTPDALIATDDDARLWSSVKIGEPVPDKIIRRYRASRADNPGQADARRRLALGLEGRSVVDVADRMIVGYIRLETAREARADELLAADDERRQARHQAKVDSGALEIEKRQERLLGEELDLQKEIPATPAQTAPGALEKIALVAEYYGDPTFGSDLEFFDWETGFRILLSAALDLKRLGGGAMRSTPPAAAHCHAEPGADA